MNYGKTSARAMTWHKLRPEDDDNPPSYCGLGMTTTKPWALMADEVPSQDLLCYRCEHSTLAWMGTNDDGTSAYFPDANPAYASSYSSPLR
jgi:hypothetical protein